MLALGWEGAICIVMPLPILLAMGTLGGVIAGLALLQRQRARAAPAVVALALLPFLVGPIEPRLPAPVEERIVENEVVLAADATTVWRHIVRVAAIQPQEQRQTFFHRIGIPQPREATLDHEGLGGVREASCHGGILFRETIDAWQPERTLGFGIRVVPESIQDGVLDEHVRVGGAYFDVLYGRFEIEPLGPQLVRLHLSSRHRLTTRLNAYAGLWSSAVMHDLQFSICQVIKRRCEAAVAPPAARASTPDRATIPGL